MIIELNEKLYSIMEKVNLFEYGKEVQLDDANKSIIVPEKITAHYKNGDVEEDALEVLEEIIMHNIVLYGMDEEDRLSEYGRKLTMLHDMLMYSDD